MEDEYSIVDDDAFKIKAAVGVVKYKILESYYKIQEYMAQYDLRRNQGEEDWYHFNLWTSELKTLYLRIKGKINRKPYKRKYKKTIKYMEYIVQNGKQPCFKNQSRATDHLFSFIDDIGITKIEKKEFNPGDIITK